MNLIKIIIIVMLSLVSVACYDVPIGPESEAYIESKLLGSWKRTDVREHPEDDFERIVLPPWAIVERHDKNPNRYWVKSETVTGEVSYNQGYSVSCNNKMFLVFWLAMSPDGPPVNYKIWHVDFHGANKLKVYSLKLPGQRSIRTIEDFRRRYLEAGASAYFYEATYEKESA